MQALSCVVGFSVDDETDIAQHQDPRKSPPLTELPADPSHHEWTTMFRRLQVLQEKEEAKGMGLEARFRMILFLEFCRVGHHQAVFGLGLGWIRLWDYNLLRQLTTMPFVSDKLLQNSRSAHNLNFYSLSTSLILAFELFDTLLLWWQEATRAGPMEEARFKCSDCQSSPSSCRFEGKPDADPSSILRGRVRC